MKTFKGTTAQFKKAFKLKELPNMLESALPKHAYMAYFFLEGRFFAHNGYGPPGYVDEIEEKDLPEDIRLYQNRLVLVEDVTPNWSAIVIIHLRAISDDGYTRKHARGIPFPESSVSEIKRMAALADKYVDLMKKARNADINLNKLLG